MYGYCRYSANIAKRYPGKRGIAFLVSVNRFLTYNITQTFCHFSVSRDSDEHFKPEYINFRAIQLFGGNGGGGVGKRLIEKIFNYLTSPINWIGKKALNSKNKIFGQIYKKINLIMEIINSFVLRKTLLENLFIPLFYYQKIYGKNLTEKMGNLLNNFRKNDLKEEKTWIKIRKDFGNLFEEIEIFVKILGNDNEEEMLSEMKKEGKIVEENKNYFLKFFEEINLNGMFFKSFKNNFGNDEEKNVVVDWLNIKKCFGGENTSISNSIQLIRKKRHYYKDIRDYNMADKVVFFIFVYLGFGGFVGIFGSTILVAMIFDEIKCPVPFIHLSEINLPEMRLPEFLRRTNQNPPPPQQQPIRNPHTGNIVTDPNELLELGYQPSDPVRYDNYVSRYGQQTRYRRGIKDNQKG
ncbi:unnamed protein product [Meloidogyne enterolobii]|uniref:Uncharacterized protein n=1 Tax=Meloidogyne enterolobii TaxID=390850 RepID=A0ACB1A7C2_MELEN